MSATTGYKLDDFGDANAEVSRLAAQAAVAASIEQGAYERVGVPEVGLGLDVGCGPGFVSMRLQALYPQLQMRGVDLDAQAVAIAADSIQTVRADARALPFATGSFDLVFTRLTLRHIPEPERALAEMVRVAKPGGRVVALDCDDGSLVLDPYPRGFRALLAARQESLQRRGADPFFARRLPRLMQRVGLRSVRFDAPTVSSEAIGVPAFVQVVLGGAAGAIDPDLLSPAAVDAAREGFAEWSARDDAFGMTTLLAVSGVKV